MPRHYYHAVMFDFDGTLVDTMHEYARIASEEMARLYGTPMDTASALYLETSGIPFFQQLEVIYGSDAKNAECANRFESRKASFLDSVRFDPGVREIIRRIRSMGLSLAITSNNFQALLDRFVRDDTGLFDLVLGFCDDYNKGPTQFTRVIDTFGVDRRHMLFLGDSLSDVRKALAFGVDFVAVAGTLRAESFRSLFPFVHVISDLKELAGLLEWNAPIRAR